MARLRIGVRRAAVFGTVAGMAGGVVVTQASGSRVSVTAPAASWIVLVASAILSAGRFKEFLLSVMLAGVWQFRMGMAQLGGLCVMCHEQSSMLTAPNKSS